MSFKKIQLIVDVFNPEGEGKKSFKNFKFKKSKLEDIQGHATKATTAEKLIVQQLRLHLGVFKDIIAPYLILLYMYFQSNMESDFLP